MVLQEESWMLMEINEMLWKFVCRWRKILGLMCPVTALILRVSILFPDKTATVAAFKERFAETGEFLLFLSPFSAYFASYYTRVVVFRTRCRLWNWTSQLKSFGHWRNTSEFEFGSLNIASGFQMGISFKWLQKRFCLPSDLLTHLRHAISWWFQ